MHRPASPRPARRAARVAVVVALALGSTACSSSEDEVDATMAALGPVEAKVADLPGVVSASLDVGYVTGIWDHDDIQVWLVSDATDAIGLVEAGRAAAELVWDSAVPAVDAIELRVDPEDDELTDASGDELEVSERMSRDDLEEAFGPRPEDD